MSDGQPSVAQGRDTRLGELTATERRRLKREQRKREQGEGTTPTIEQPIVGMPSTPTSPEDSTSSLSGYFRRRRGD